MLSLIFNFITNSGKTATTAVASVTIGQLSTTWTVSKANTALQHGAWTIAILAGILTVINLFFPLRTFYQEYKIRKHERYIKENE